MLFTERIKKKIIDILHSKKASFKTGSSCLYLQLSENIGVKIYKDRSIRNQAHKNQIKFYKKQLAPKVGDKFEIPFMCFLDYRENDQIAHEDLQDSRIDWVTYYGYITKHAQKIRRVDSKSVNRFLEKVESMGYNTYDLENHWNIGRINNRVVCIDTDERTLERV